MELRLLKIGGEFLEVPYKLYVRLRQAEILSKHSPKDIIEQSKAIHKLKIRGEWHRSEITKKTRELFAKIGIDYLK